MDQDILSLIQKPHIFLPALCAAVWISSIFVNGVVACIRGTARERTRREIAAYIAEGSLSAEQGERLMKAEPKSSSSSCMG